MKTQASMLVESTGINEQAPIDGGLGLLTAAGPAYALKKLRGRKKDAENNTV